MTINADYAKDFNDKFRDAVSELVLRENNSLIETPGFETKKVDCEVFVYLTNPDGSLLKGLKSLSISDEDQRSIVTVNEIRILLLTNFLAKILNKRIKVFVNSKKTTENKNYLVELEKMFNYFQFEKNIELVPIEINSNEVSLLKNSLLSINDEFKVQPDDQSQKNIVDLSRIIENFSLKFYDKNLKYVNCEHYRIDSADLVTTYHKFLSLIKSERLLNICFTSEFYQRQKNDLMSRIALETTCPKQSRNYICIGKAFSPNQKEIDVFYQIQLREKYFRNSAKQRNLISDEKSELNICNFTKFSLTYDILSLAHHNDIKRLDTFSNLAENESQGDQSSFILYNCARLHAIIEKFENLQANGVYKSLTSISDLDFNQHLKSDFEQKICKKFLFVYKKMMSDLQQEPLEVAAKSLQTKINTPKLFRFMSDLSNLFSKYYSKVHVLEDPKLVHLHETMHCRIYLLKAVYNLFEVLLGLFNIDPVNRI